MHPRIVLHLTYQGPIGLTRVHLCTGTSMNGQSLNTTILQLLGQVHNHLMIFVPSQTGLHRNWHLHRIDHCSRNLEHQRNVLQHARTSPFASHTLHRAAKVQVKHIGLSLLHNACSLYHGRHIAAVNLNSHGTLLVADTQLLFCLCHRTNQCISRHKLRIDHISAKALAHQAESRIRNILHRCQEHRLVGQLHITYFHLLFSSILG